MHTDQVGSIGLNSNPNSSSSVTMNKIPNFSMSHLLICKIRISENVTELHPAQSKFYIFKSVGSNLFQLMHPISSLFLASLLK